MTSYIISANNINTVNAIAKVDWTFTSHTPSNLLDEKMNNAHNLYTN